MPFHLPTPLDRVNRPVPMAWRGPATPLILFTPEPEMRPSKAILCITNLPLVAEMWPPVTAMPILIVPQWPLVVIRTMFQAPSKGPTLRAQRKRKVDSGRQSDGGYAIANHGILI